MSDKPEMKRRIRRLFQTLVLGSGALATLSACGDSPKPQTPTPEVGDGGTATPKAGGSGFW
jgi:hypothetical protein